MIFPIIKTIDDVIPSIKNRDEFFVAEREFGTVINYKVALPDSFDDPIRRECRGIIFYSDGRIMSRPYHKFFNLGEKNETLPTNLDFSRNPVIMDKLDGSMIRPIWLPDGTWKFATKMGVTNIADQAYNWLYSPNVDLSLRKNYEWFIEDCKDKFTPIFEWCSRQQRIVLDYPEDQLILTGLRNNETGRYYDISPVSSIPIVKTWDRMDLEQIQEMAAKNQDQEGWVIAFDDGHRVKIKLDWYVTLHKVKESICREKYVIDAILNNYMDDLRGKLLDEDRARVEKFEDEFLKGLFALQDKMIDLFNKYRNQSYRLSRDLKDVVEPESLQKIVRKQLAQEILKEDSHIRSYIFKMLDGDKNAHEYAVDASIDLILNHTKTQTMIDKNRHLWGGAKYDYRIEEF